ncbi:hypothetical protein OOY67_004500 [Vibrio parahaemolyticus]|nr:hypothetical protein [Vibrio parahaemolyticus]
MQVYKGLQLEKRKNNPNIDAWLGKESVQIKFSDSAYTENIALGNPDKYNRLIVVLGKNSKHRKTDSPDADFLFYSYTSNEVKEKFMTSTNHTLTKRKHFKDHEFLLNL